MIKPRQKPSDIMVGDLYEGKAEQWNKNLRARMREEGLSQRGLAEKVNERFVHEEAKAPTNYSQKSVHDWLHVGPDAGGKPFPRYEIMVQIAEVLGTTVERLTGETDYESRRAEVTGQYLGIAPKAVAALRRLVTVFDSPFRGRSEAEDCFFEDVVLLLESLLASDGLQSLLRSMLSLEMARSRITNSKSRVETTSHSLRLRYGEELFKKAGYVDRHMCLPPAYTYEGSLEDYWSEFRDHLLEGGIERHELSDIFAIINELESAADRDYGQGFADDMIETAYRYQAQRAFGDLLDEVYPPIKEG